MATIPPGFASNQSGYYTRGDGAGPFSYDGNNMVYEGYGPITTYSSGNVANAIATATIPAVAGRLNYLAGFDISGGGATTGAIVLLTITGCLGGTMTYSIAVPTGATLGVGPTVVSFNRAIQASAVNTAIVVSMQAFGAGNTNASVNVRGLTL